MNNYKNNNSNIFEESSFDSGEEYNDTPKPLNQNKSGRILRMIMTIILCAALVFSVLGAIGTSFLQRTIFSQDFYNGIVATPDYLTMVKNSIKSEFRGQASYVGVPDEIFHEMLDDAALHLMLRNHISSVTSFLNYGTPIENSGYPLDMAKQPLYNYLEEVAVLQGFSATQEQYDQLDDVAEDSAKIIAKHVNLINIDLVKDQSIFLTIWNFALRARALIMPAIIASLVAIALIIAINFRNWRIWSQSILVSFWLAGSLLMIPTVVLNAYQMTRRLAIETPYLKYAVDTLLTSINHYFMVWGIALFIFSTIGMITIKLTEKPVKKRKRRSSGSEKVLSENGF